MNKYSDRKHASDTQNMTDIINARAQIAKINYENDVKRNNEEEEQRLAYLKEKKRVKKAFIRKAILSIALIGTIALGTHIGININTETQAEKDINSKISEYEQLMNMYSDKENSIEINQGRSDYTSLNSEALVSYNHENLAKHLVNAAEKSELETRCVTIAAYKIINEPYRDNVIGDALRVASANQDESTNYEIPGTTQEYLEKLGYDNWQDYHMEERANIVELYNAELAKTSEGRGK